MGFPAKKPDIPGVKKEKKRYFRKHDELHNVLQKIKLWPSRTGTLHGIRSMAQKGGYIEFVTHCGNMLRIKDSKTSRVARWLRNKWYVKPCPKCKVPGWKLEKYSSTSFQ